MDKIVFLNEKIERADANNVIVIREILLLQDKFKEQYNLRIENKQLYDENDSLKSGYQAQLVNITKLEEINRELKDKLQ